MRWNPCSFDVTVQWRSDDALGEIAPGGSGICFVDHRSKDPESREESDSEVESSGEAEVQLDAAM